MSIPINTIVNADDLGLSSSINKAILYCFESGYINSTSFITNTDIFEETITYIYNNPIIANIGVHVNLAEGKPITDSISSKFLNRSGNWDLQKINRKITVLTKKEQLEFAKEITAQIEKALSSDIRIVHIDSHYHLHTLPCFYGLFLQAAKKYEIRLRLAQTYNEGNFIKYFYRKWINHQYILANLNYSDRFETVKQYLKTKNNITANNSVEIMLHPDLGNNGELTDHYDKTEILSWIEFLNNN